MEMWELGVLFLMGLVSGLAVGYNVKVMVKLLLVLLGFVVVVDLALWWLGIISVHPEAVVELVQGFIEGGSSTDRKIVLPKITAGFVVFSIGMAIGIYLALRKLK